MIECGNINCVLCISGVCACRRLSLQIEPPRGAEIGSTDAMSTVDGSRTVVYGSQLYIRAESAPCVKAHSFCSAGGSGMRPIHWKTKTTTAE